MFKDGSIEFSDARRGTVSYRAPELTEFTFDEYGNCQAAVVSKKLDTWAMGCILFRLATTNTAVAFKDDFDVVGYANRSDAEVPQICRGMKEALECQTWTLNGESATFRMHINSILKFCFAKDPEERATAADLKRTFEGMEVG